jgi:hypothetical protein
MTTYRVQFIGEIDVKFDDPKKTKDFYIDDEERSWSKIFYDVDNLADLAEIIATLFNTEDDIYHKKSGSFSTRFIEGFGRFVKQENTNQYALTRECAEQGGQIRIRYNMEIVSISTEILSND